MTVSLGSTGAPQTDTGRGPARNLPSYTLIICNSDTPDSESDIPDPSGLTRLCRPLLYSHDRPSRGGCGCNGRRGSQHLPGRRRARAGTTVAQNPAETFRQSRRPQVLLAAAAAARTPHLRPSTRTTAARPETCAQGRIRVGGRAGDSTSDDDSDEAHVLRFSGLKSALTERRLGLERDSHCRARCLGPVASRRALGRERA